MRFASFFEWLQSALSRIGLKDARRFPAEGTAGNEDLFAATRELSRLLVAETPASSSSCPTDAADISITLGNLFRAQGDLERAVRLREALLARMDADAPLKARIFFELGCDYRKAGLLDRALSAYKEARKLGHPALAVSEELAHLFADSGDFSAAAAESAVIGNPRAEAYFLVKQAEDQAAAGNDDTATKLIRRAIDVYPGSPEAWLALACMSLAAGSGVKAGEHFVRGLTKAGEQGRLILLEGLHAFIVGPTAPAIPETALHDLFLAIVEFSSGREADLMLCYYNGLFMQRMKKADEAEQWFTKALVIEQEFWAARLALLALIAERDREFLPPLLAQQIAFFTRKAAESKRFFCKPCGMRRNSVFSFCPRCRAWHSVAFRLYLN